MIQMVNRQLDQTCCLKERDATKERGGIISKFKFNLEANASQVFLSLDPPPPPPS